MPLLNKLYFLLTLLAHAFPFDQLSALCLPLDAIANACNHNHKYYLS